MLTDLLTGCIVQQVPIIGSAFEGTDQEILPLFVCDWVVHSHKYKKGALRPLTVHILIFLVFHIGWFRMVSIVLRTFFDPFVFIKKDLNTRLI